MNNNPISKAGLHCSKGKCKRKGIALIGLEVLCSKHFQEYRTLKNKRKPKRERPYDLFKKTKDAFFKQDVKKSHNHSPGADNRARQEEQ